MPIKNIDDDAWNILEAKPLYIIKEVEITDNTKLESSYTTYELPKTCNFFKSHPKQHIIGNLEQGIQIRATTRNEINNMTMLYQ